MTLLTDIAFYGVGAVVLTGAVLVLIGLVGGLIAYRQASKNSLHIERSGILAEIETRRLAFEASRRTAADDAAERVIYPSRRFEKDTRRLIDGGAAFVVAVAANSRKRQAVERELPAMIHLHDRRDGLLRDVVDKYQTLGLWSCIAHAVLNGEYLVTYDVVDDIAIRFEPKPVPDQLRAIGE